MPKYFPIRTKSDHSLLYGFGQIEEYVQKAKKLNLKYLGLADKHTASGLYDFINECNKENIIPIAGVEFFLAEKEKLTPITLYAKNKMGLKHIFNLVKLSFTNKKELKDEPFITMEQILNHNEGVIILTGYENTLVSEAIKTNDNDIYYHLKSLQDTFGDDLYLSISKMSDYALEIGKKMEINVIPTNEVLFTEKEHEAGCNIFWALRTGFKMNETDTAHGGKRPVCSERNVFPISETLNDISYQGFYTNLEELGKKVNLKLEFDTHLKPKAVLEEGKTEIGELKKLIQKGFKEKRAGTKYAKESKKRIAEELDTIWGNDYLDYFLVVQDYCEYARHHAGGLGAGRGSAAGSEIGYLIGIHDADPIKHDLLFERFLSPGRGSEYTITYEDGTEEKSIVSEKHEVDGKMLYTHQLNNGDITDGKKIKTVVMTRPTASSVDVDTDFHTIGRKKVIDYVKKKYGENRISNVITFGTFKTLNAIKSVGQVTNIPFYKMNQANKVIDSSKKLSEILQDTEESKKFKEWTESLGSEGGLVYKYAPMVEGRIRNQGVHACAILISPVDLQDIIPVEINPKDGTLTSQWEYHACEGIGLLKMDFLGLDTVDLIDNTIKMIEINKGVKVDKQAIIDSDLNDKKTFELFRQAKTDGIFQFSGDGVKDFLLELQPDVFEDLYAVTALYRPGPIGMGAHKSFAKRKAGTEERIPFDNKKLLNTDVYKVLEETYELIPYQESLMNLARICADFTPYETDLLRKATAKKKEELLKSLKPKFLSGLKKHVNNEKKKQIIFTVKNKMPNATKKEQKEQVLKLAKKYLLTDKDMEDIWANLEEFSSYSFNKSHSVSYTLNAYISAYLKANFPVEFMATLLRQNAKDKDKFKTFSQDARSMGIKLYPPDVNYSEVSTVAKGDSIVYGLDMIAFVGSDVIREIVFERKENGKYSDMANFISRVAKRTHLTKKTITSLASVGAFKSLKETRKGIIDGVDSIIAYANNKSKNLNNSGLFGDAPTFVLNKEEYPFVKLCQLEYESCGYFLTGNPLDKIEPGDLDRTAYKPTKDEVRGKTGTFKKFKTLSPNKQGNINNTFKVSDFIVFVSDIKSKGFKNNVSFEITLDTGVDEVIAKPGPLNGYTNEPLTSTGKLIEVGKVYKMTLSYSTYRGYESLNIIDLKEVTLNNDGTFGSMK